MSHSNITDSAFDVSYNSISNEDALFPNVELGDIISDAKRKQHVYIDKLKREVIQMNILIRICDERRDAFLNFDADENNSTKVHIGDNLAKDILPEAIVVHTKRLKISTKDSHSDTVATHVKSDAALPSSPSVMELIYLSLKKRRVVQSLLRSKPLWQNLNSNSY